MPSMVAVLALAGRGWVRTRAMHGGSCSVVREEAEGSRRRSGAFRASCLKKGEGSNSEGGGSFDARACVARYVVERARARDARVKLDRDGTLVHATRGTAPGAYGRNAYEKPYWRETKKAPCVWRFDDAAAGAGDMMDMIARFPGAFV